MPAHGPPFTISMLFLILLIIMMAQANTTSPSGTQSSQDSSSSLWLQRMIMTRRRSTGCSRRPLVCTKGREPGKRMACCKNRCVDVGSDVYNCGSCGGRCPFPWQCCGGECVDTNVDHSNCGECGNKCPSLVMCSFGMCGYARPLPLPPQSLLGIGTHLANPPPPAVADPEF